jgi:hypothetical protein
MDHCPHNPDFECFTCADARHAVEHPYPVDGCRECKYATILISPAVRASSRDSRTHHPPTAFTPKNSWERGIATDGRGVPLLDADLSPIPIKRYAERRHVYEARRRELAQHPDPFGVKTGGT